MKLKVLPFLICRLVLCNQVNGQQVVADSLQRHYKRSLHVTHIATGAVLFTGLYSVWFKDYSNGKFHLFNDNKEWMQIDKIGHAYSNFQISTILAHQYRWVGYNAKQAALYAFAASNVYFLGIEVMDGFSEGWGFSAMDIVANFSGSALASVQQAVWQESKIQLKFGYIPSPYPKYRPDLLGNNFQSKLIKDYNAQSYWLAMSPFAFTNQNKWWQAIQFSIGYGANGMIAANESKQIELGYSDIPRYRQYMFSLDFDLTKLPIKNPNTKRWLKYLNAIKLPLPQMVYTSNKLAFQAFPKY